MTIEESIWKHAAETPDKIAVKSGKDSCTYRELTGRIAAAAEKYRSLPGYTPGRAIMLAAGKQIEFIYAYFGAHMAGLTVAPMDAETNPTRFKYITDAIKPFAVIGFDLIDTEVQKVSLSDFKALAPISAAEVTFPNPESTADILFTTGTTGAPKGVPLTFANETAAAHQINAFIRNSSDDVEILALPVSHSFGLGRVRCCLTNGQTIILFGSFVNIKRLFRFIEEEHVTGFTMVPASWKYLQKMSGNDLAKFAPQFKYIEMGSAFFSAEDKRALAALFPTTRVTMHYGLTEASRSAFMEFHEDDAKLSTVGKASPEVEIAIFDSEGNRLPAGCEGEICIRGKHVTRGYLQLDAKDFFFGDFFRTGDCGVMDDEGYITLKSRIKELINVGGKKVAPVEVDEQILKIPGVVDCACAGVPDPSGVLGEVVKAFVVKDPASDLSFEKIAASLQGKLESYKLPAEYAWIDAVPKTHNGKIQRGLLK